LRAAGMMVQVDHMLGIPGDTLEIEEEAALFYNQFRPHVISVFWLTYYPKTPIIDIAKQKGILSAQDIENINEGHAFTERSFHAGGSMKDPRPYYGICLLFNCIPLLPKWLVKYLLKQKTYRKISINNYFTLVGFPRFLLAILNRKNFIDRGYLVRFINKIFSHELC
jgi:hypothetical protein